MEEEKKDLKHLPTFILRSKYRKDVFLKLIEHPFLTQSELLKETSPKYRAHISRTIKELLEENLIICENPCEKIYKLYKPSEKGLKVSEEISRYGKDK